MHKGHKLFNRRWTQILFNRKERKEHKDALISLAGTARRSRPFPFGRAALPCRVEAPRNRMRGQIPLAANRWRVHYPNMPRRKKLSPASSRRLAAPECNNGGNRMKAEEMRKHIHSLRGKIKLNTGGKPFAEWWADHKREEKELEEKRFQRLAALGKKTIIQG